MKVAPAWFPFWVSIVVVVLLAAGCSGDPAPSTSDAGTDASGANLAVEIGRNVDGQFQPFSDQDPTIEVVSGFQGGFHVGPALRIDSPAADKFITVVDYAVTDVDTGEALAAEPSKYRVDQSTWEPRPGGKRVRLWERYVLDVDGPDAVTGRTVRIDVDLKVEGGLGAGSDSVVVKVVDNVDETAGGGAR